MIVGLSTFRRSTSSAIKILLWLFCDFNLWYHYLYCKITNYRVIIFINIIYKQKANKAQKWIYKSIYIIIAYALYFLLWCTKYVWYSWSLKWYCIVILRSNNWSCFLPLLNMRQQLLALLALQDKQVID